MSFNAVDIVKQVELNRMAGGVDFEAAAAAFDPGPAGDLEAGAGAAGTPPELGPSFEIGGEPVAGSTPVLRQYPAVAYGGGTYMMVWQDRRGYDDDIYGARVSPSGALLDSLGILICDAYNPQGDPDIAFDGTNFMVVWEDRRSGDSSVFGARVSPAGEVLEPSDIMICVIVEDQIDPSIAFDGANYLVVWTDYRGDGSDVFGARVSPSGTMLDVNGFLIRRGSCYAPGVAASGGTFLVVWQEDTDPTSAAVPEIYGTRIASSGAVLDPEGIVACEAEETQSNPSVASDGTDFMVVWTDKRAPGSSDDQDIYGARITAAGEVLDPDGIAVSVAAGNQGFPQFAFGAGVYVAVWRDYASEEVRGARVDPSGTVLDPDGVEISRSNGEAGSISAVSSDGTGFMVTWIDYRRLYDIYCARVSATLTHLDTADMMISYTVNGQYVSASAFDGENYLVVWTDTRNYDGVAPYDIYGARVTPSGEVLDPQGIPIASGDSDQRDPSVAFDGEVYLVVWQDSRDGTLSIYGARVTPSGTVLDPDGMLIAPANTWLANPDVAFDGINYMVVWTDVPENNQEIYVARVSPQGAVLDPEGIPVTVGHRAEGTPAIAFNGTNYLVVWRDAREDYYRTYGARVTPEGTVLDLDGVRLSTQDDMGQHEPDVASDGRDFMVVWYNYRRIDEINYYDLYGARVSGSGVVLNAEDILISSARSTQASATIAFDGRNYMVAWEDYRDRSWNIYAARVSRSGEVIDSEGLGLMCEPESQWDPCLALGRSGQMLIAYTFWVAAPDRRAARIYGNMWNYVDDTPPVLTVSVHQNPELTSEVGIYVVPSEAVQDTSFRVTVNGEPLQVSPGDSSKGIYRADYKLSGSGTYTIDAHARDTVGNAADTSRAFGAGIVLREAGGFASSPGREVSLECPAGSVTRDCYVLVLPDERAGDCGLWPAKDGENGDAATGAVAGDLEGLAGYGGASAWGTAPGDGERMGFVISPPSLTLELPARLAVRVKDNDGRPMLERRTASGWEPVECDCDEASRTMTALITRLGDFRVTWDQSGSHGTTPALLLSNVPNPFRDQVDLRYHLPAGGQVRVGVHDAAGRLVKTLCDGWRGPGWQVERWDGSDENGRAVPSGVYFTSVETPSGEVRGKCVLVR